ncbi:GNAT family N-acetyltransferase [Phaeobacter sp.]|uniref:GNAT family N-acetyltransferase n=1 Tax=Phaeobacter sp. TaxID=1902409 RepID=UPI0025E93BC7|nr:N-acetyltransferase [Phaeobacter sp.]
MIELKPEQPDDRWEVEALYDLCFAPGREALSSYRLRDGVPAVAGLSQVARDEAGILAGAIRFWPVRVAQADHEGAAASCSPGHVSDQPNSKPLGHQPQAHQPQANQPPAHQPAGHAALLLGPVAVHPTHQGEGLGGALIRDSLAKAAEDRWSRVLLVGDAPYYARFGFTLLAGVEMPPPTNPDRVLGLELQPGAWADVRGQVLRWSADVETAEERAGGARALT